MQRRGIRVSALLIVSALGCAKPGTPATSAPVGTGASAVAHVTAAGGEVGMGDVKLVVPPTAVSEATPIRVTSTKDSAPAGQEAYSPVYKFEPDGQVFPVPVTVTLAFQGDARHAVVYWSKRSGPGYEPIGGMVNDDGTISVAISHFSQGFVGNDNPCGQDLKNDVNNCGSCANVCAHGNAPQTCKEGTCVDTILIVYLADGGSITVDGGIAIVAGPQGPEGETGPAGPAGQEGPQGATGAMGPQGGPGLQGPQGDRGDTGAQGLRGDKGEVGPKGADGARGDTGARGMTGAKGDVGPKGDPGIQGLRGEMGPVGLVGPQGMQGPRGDKGDTGVAGAVGALGAVGVKGEIGSQGPPGTRGETGAQGLQGIQGVAGAPGVEGHSVVGASEAAGANCAQGGVRLVSASGINFICNGESGVAGEKGDRGDSGPQGLRGDTGAVGPRGENGETGPQGARGESGAVGAVGPMGVTGAQGPTGTTGATGAQGVRGEMGAAGPTGAMGAIGARGDNGADGIPVVGSSEPSGANCPTGGLKLVSVSGTNFICNGEPGAQGLMGLAGAKGDSGAAGTSVYGASEAPGTNCATGGVKLVAVSGTYFVCNGAVGAAGTTGAAGVAGTAGATGATGPQGPTGGQGPAGATGVAGSSVVGSSGGAGANCPAGGVRLVSVSGTQYVCNGIAGAQGPAGAAGATGATGATGPQGPIGATGATGSRGSPGPGSSSLHAAQSADVQFLLGSWADVPGTEVAIDVTSASSADITASGSLNFTVGQWGEAVCALRLVVDGVALEEQWHSVAAAYPSSGFGVFQGFTVIDRASLEAGVHSIKLQGTRLVMTQGGCRIQRDTGRAHMLVTVR